MPENALTAIAQQVCEKRYFQKDAEGNIIEDWEGLVTRVVDHVCKNEDEKFRQKAFDLLYKTEFLPNSPCLVNGGKKTKSRGLQACQPGWSRINTNNGLIRIEDIVNEENVNKIPTFTGETSITNRCYNGTKNVIQIETEKGYRLSVTEDHLVYTISDYHRLGSKNADRLKKLCMFEKADNLKIGDALVLDFSEKPFPNKCIYKNNIKVDEDLARILAFTKCDGHLKYHRGGLKKYGQQVLVFEIIVDSEESLHLITNSAHMSGNIIDIDNQQGNSCLKRVRAYGEKYSYLFNFGQFDSLNCDIPDEIFRSPKKVVAEFCRAAFDCEGSISFNISSKTNTRNGHVALGMISEQFVRDLQKLLNLFGIQSSISGPVYDNRTNYKRHPMFYLSITNTVHLKKFQEQIGFISKRKNRILGDYLATTKDKNYNKFAFVIKDIVDLGEYPVYDISTCNETYLSEGIVVHNCFVSKSPEDCWSDPEGVGMVENIANFGHIARQGGGAGVDLSLIRPEGDPVFGSTHAKACGPIEHMKMLSEVMASITQSGFRGMAMLACMRVDHPDILKFITCKRRDRALKNFLKEDIFDHYSELKDTHHEHLDIVLDKFLSNFNISVSVTDDFMNKVKNDEKYDLVFNEKIYETIEARKVFNAIVENAWNNGDPGLLFYDAINRATYRWSNQTITATNPCITGDTLISVADGRVAIPIKQLALENKDVPVYCRKPNGNVTIRMMRHPRMSGFRQRILKIQITNGHTLRVTENHRFRLSDGSIKEARELKKNDSLAILTRAEASFEYILKKWNSKSQQYVWLRTSECKSWKLEHRMIYNSANNKRLSYREGVIHHKDFNGLNNHPSNLEQMKKEDHDTLHGQNMLGDNNPNKNNMSNATKGLKNGRALNVTNNELFDMAIMQTKKIGRKLTNLEWRQFSKKNELISQFSNFRKEQLGLVGQFLTNAAIKAGVMGQEFSGVLLREYKRFLQIETDLDVFFDNGCKVRKNCEQCGNVFILSYYQREIGYCSIQCSLIKRNKSDEMKQKVRKSKLELLNKRRKNLLSAYTKLKMDIQKVPLKKEFSLYCKNQNIPFRIPSKREVKEGKLHPIFHSWVDLQEQAELFNHRIVSIEQDGQSDVYTGTVDDYHNYYTGHFEEQCDKKCRKFIYINNLQCGEIPIPEYGSCNLGSIDISKFYNDSRKVIEWTRLKHTIEVCIQFLDNVIDANVFPTPDFKKWAKDNRPVGLGIMGWADLLLQMEIIYGSEDSLKLAHKVARFFQKTAHEKSVELGKERGTPRSCRYKELEYRRNVVTLSIAPTGTISLLAGCSSSIEPIFSAITYRYDNTGSKEMQHPYASKSWFRCASDLHWKSHIEMQATFQDYIDNSISKCIVGNSLVFTNKGFQRIKDLSNNREDDTFSPLSIEVLNGKEKKQWKHAEKFYYGGKRRTIKIETKNGFVIEGTPNHKIKIFDGEIRFKRLDELQIGQYCPIPFNTQYFGNIVNLSAITQSKYGNSKHLKIPEHLDIDLSYLLGVILAEGNYQGNNSVIITHCNKEILQELDNMFESKFGIGGSIVLDKRTESVYKLQVNSRNLVKWMQGVADIRRGASNKIIPSIILNSTQENIAAFLGGLFFDGFLIQNSHGTKLGLCLASESIIRDLQIVLANMGIASNIIKKYDKEYDKYFHEILIYGDSLFKFKDLITLRETHKQNRLLNISTVRSHNYHLGLPELVTEYIREVVNRSELNMNQFVSQTSNYRIKMAIYNKSRMKIEDVKDSLDFFGGVEKHRIYDVLQSNSHCIFQKIVSIEDSEEEVFDIYVPDGHAFVANGFINHNTINFPHEATKKDIENAYISAFEHNCKGITVYRDGCKTTQVLNTSKRGVVGANHAKQRPKEVQADIFKTRADGIDWHVIVGTIDGNPHEVFAVNGRRELPSTGLIIKRKKRHYSLLDDDGVELIDNIGDEEDNIHPKIAVETRRFSLELRHNIDPKFIVQQIDKSHDTMTSFSKAVARIFRTKYISVADLTSISMPCPECAKKGKSVQMISESSCCRCPTCFYSRCG